MHAFWQETDPQGRTNEMTHFLQDMAIAGGALVLLGVFTGDLVGLTITGPLL